jgi:CHAD domain-containing protein
MRVLSSVLGEQLQQLQRHEPGVRLGGDVEDLHKFRVATRRSRAIIRATKPLLGDSLGELSAELKWLTGALGPVRDLDVLLERLRGTAKTLGDDTREANAIIGSLEEEHERRYDALRAALDDDRYLALLDTFASNIASLPDLDAPDGLRPLAARPLRKLRKGARKLGDEPTDEELHKLRIRAKRARYAAELIPDGGKRLERYLSALKDLQDVLGEHQDAVVAEEQVRRVAGPETGVAAGRLIELEHQRRLERRSEYPRALARALRRGRKAKLGK